MKIWPPLRVLILYEKTYRTLAFEARHQQRKIFRKSFNSVRFYPTVLLVSDFSRTSNLRNLLITGISTHCSCRYHGVLGCTSTADRALFCVYVCDYHYEEWIFKRWNGSVILWQLVWSPALKRLLLIKPIIFLHEKSCFFDFSKKDQKS